ncbi:glycosyltransferase family 4 protein [Saccharopolyspora halophila]|uniref:Glycosyltransferase family 4 protein n=1 Tax=Saccharopolyspora halophila TaxID=405551 RepID=A0ABN3GTL1_9PSEU
MSAHVVLPGDVDDPNAPSGGNTYDRRVCAEIARLGIELRETRIPGNWPQPDETARALLADALATVPDGGAVLLDGLVACGVPDVVGAHASRLRQAILVHLPLAEETGLDPALAARLDAAEREVLHAAAVVVATGPRAAQRLVRHHDLPPEAVRTVAPGTDPAPSAPGTDGSSRLLCVASVTPRKGHDLLVTALARLRDLPWTCDLAGPVARDGAHARRVAELIERHSLGDRVRLLGPLSGAALDDAYAAADLVVQPSRAETYGMAVTEALARGIPVIASAVPDALGDGGLLLPPGDADALTEALRRWSHDERFRSRMREAARQRREQLPTWRSSARQLAAVLARLET